MVVDVVVSSAFAVVVTSPGTVIFMVVVMGTTTGGRVVIFMVVVVGTITGGRVVIFMVVDLVVVDGGGLSTKNTHPGSTLTSTLFP